MSGHSPTKRDQAIPGYGAVVNQPLTEAQRKLLRGYVQEYERLGDEIAVLKLDQSEILNVAKASGLDVAAIRELVRRRKLEADDRRQFDLFQDTVTTYELALCPSRAAHDRPFAPPLDDGEKIGRAIFPSAEQQDRAMFAAKDATKN